MSLGWRKISTNSFPRNEEIRMRNLNIDSLLFDYFDEYIIKRSGFLLDHLYGQSLRLRPFHQQRNRYACLINDHFDFLIINNFHFATREGLAFQLSSVFKPDSLRSSDCDQIAAKGLFT